MQFLRRLYRINTSHSDQIIHRSHNLAQNSIDHYADSRVHVVGHMLCNCPKSLHNQQAREVELVIVELLLVHCLRRWPNITLTLVEPLVAYVRLGSDSQWHVHSV